MVSLKNPRQHGSFRIWLGSRRRIRRLHCWTARGRTKRGRVGAVFSSLAHGRRAFRNRIFDTICAWSGRRAKCSKKEGDRGRLAHPPPRAGIRSYERYRGRLVMLCDRARVLARSDRPETIAVNSQWLKRCRQQKGPNSKGQGAHSDKH